MLQGKPPWRRQPGLPGDVRRKQLSRRAPPARDRPAARRRLLKPSAPALISLSGRRIVTSLSRVEVARGSRGFSKKAGGLRFHGRSLSKFTSAGAGAGRRQPTSGRTKSWGPEALRRMAPLCDERGWGTRKQPLRPWGAGWNRTTSCWPAGCSPRAASRSVRHTRQTSCFRHLMPASVPRAAGGRHQVKRGDCFQAYASALWLAASDTAATSASRGWHFSVCLLAGNHARPGTVWSPSAFGRHGGKS